MAQSCGKQWTIADTNNDLALSREEAEASREMEFSRLDQNGDGQISEEEWAVCNDMAIIGEAMSAGRQEEGSDSGSQASSSGTQAGADEAAAGRPMINGLIVPDARVGDADQSGDLSREELVEAMKQKYAEASEAAKDQADKAPSEETQARFSGAWFRLHDKNNDGKISPQEVAEADLERAGEQAFERVDENNDGIITRDEYSKWVTTRYEAAQEQASGGLPITVWHYYVLAD